MADLFTRLAQRALGAPSPLRPSLGPAFEPDHDVADPLGETPREPARRVPAGGKVVEPAVERSPLAAARSDGPVVERSVGQAEPPAPARETNPPRSTPPTTPPAPNRSAWSAPVHRPEGRAPAPAAALEPKRDVGRQYEEHQPVVPTPPAPTIHHHHHSPDGRRLPADRERVRDIVRSVMPRDVGPPAAQPPRTPAISARAEHAPTRVVQVTIGRVEVRAVQSAIGAVARPPAPRAAASPDLAAYLRSRGSR